VEDQGAHEFRPVSSDRFRHLRNRSTLVMFGSSGYSSDPKRALLGLRQRAPARSDRNRRRPCHRRHRHRLATPRAVRKSRSCSSCGSFKPPR